MNRYWHVVQTYLWRLRFWILAAAYLLILSNLRYPNVDPQIQRVEILALAVVSCAILCFVALHVRRQFGTAAAYLTPGFELPHLIVGAAAGVLLWVVVPVAMILAGRWPPGALAVHAVAGILFGAVASWPRALMLLLALPVFIFWADQDVAGRRSLLDRFIQGEAVVLSTTFIGLALAAQVVAVIFLRRLPQHDVSTNDELSLEPAVTVQTSNPVGNFLLIARDATASRLIDARFLSSVRRWRVPVVASPVQWLIPFAIVLAFCFIGWLFDYVSDWATLATITTSAVLLLVPYGPWHVRRRAWSLELTRPVTRPHFFRQMMTALALDAGMWALVASVLSISVFSIVPAFRESGDDRIRFLVGYLAILWTMAVFIYGVAVITMRLPLWMPIVAAIALSWLVGMWPLIAIMAEGVFFTTSFRPGGALLIGVFAFLSAGVSWVLIRVTYRRWLRMEIP